MQTPRFCAKKFKERKMRFPNAAKGINKIFASEILSLIATIASGIAAILTILFVDSGSTGNSAGAIASELSILIFGIAGLMLMFIAFIFQLIGVIQASKDESFFKAVIFLTLAGLLFTAIAQWFITSNAIVYNICGTLALVADIVASLFMILGISSLASQCENNAIVGLITKFFSIFVTSESAKAIVAVFSVISLILNITQYVLYIMILTKTRKMLKESKEN